MRPVTLGLNGIKDPVVLAALTEIQRASYDTLQNDTSSSAAAISTVVGATLGSGGPEIPYFKTQYTTGFIPLSAGGSAASQLIRIRVDATITFFVSTTGSDANDGLTVGTPWRHIQHAIDYVCNNIDICNVLVKIKLADGTYAESVVLRDYVGAVFPTQIVARGSATEPRIEGNTSTPANVVIGDGSSPAFFAASMLMPWFIDGVTVKNGIFTDYASLVNIGTVTFSTNTSGAHITSRYGSRVEIIAGSVITVAANASAFASAQVNGIILAQGAPGAVTGIMSGTPVFSDAYVKVNDQSSTVDLNAISWTGSATGPHAYINGGANGSADPTTYPGNSAPIYDTQFLSPVAIPVAKGGTGDTGTAWTAYTPTIAAGSGAFTTVSATGRYKQLGKTVFVEISIVDTTNGTAAGFVNATLPVAPFASDAYTLSGIVSVSGAAAIGNIKTSGGGSVNFFKYDGTYPIGTGINLWATGVYEAA